MRVVELSNLTWTLTGLAAVVVLLTRIRLGGSDRTSGVSSVSTRVLALHTVVGVLAIGAWVAALVTGNRTLALGSLVAWWLLTVAGLLLLARWVPSGGRHSDQKATDAWGEGAGLSILAHLGMLVGVCYFTYVAVSGRL